MGANMWNTSCTQTLYYTLGFIILMNTYSKVEVDVETILSLFYT